MVGEVPRVFVLAWITEKKVSIKVSTLKHYLWLSATCYPLNLWISLLSSLGLLFKVLKLNNKINCTNNSQWITFTYSQAFSTASVYTYLKIVLLILQFLVLTLLSFIQRNKPDRHVVFYQWLCNYQRVLYLNTGFTY